LPQAANRDQCLVAASVDINTVGTDAALAKNLSLGTTAVRMESPTNVPLS
jgi:hypothetical protein